MAIKDITTLVDLNGKQKTAQVALDLAARTGAHVPCLGATVRLATQFFDEHFA